MDALPRDSVVLSNKMAAMPEDVMFDYDLMQLVEQEEIMWRNMGAIAQDMGNQPAAEEFPGMSVDADMIAELLEDNEALLDEAMKLELQQQNQQQQQQQQPYAACEIKMENQMEAVQPVTSSWLLSSALGGRHKSMWLDHARLQGTASPTTREGLHETTEEEQASDSDRDSDVEHDQLKVELKKRDREQSDEEDVTSELELLKKEAKFLSAQYDFLVSSARSNRDVRARAKLKRRIRQQQLNKTTTTAQDNAFMRDMLSQQKVYVENFRAMLAFAPVNDVRLALMTPLESYIHLGRDFDERRQRILGIREEKLDMTHKYIEQKALGIDTSTPYYHSDVFEKFGKVYSASFSVSKFEGVTVKDAVDTILQHICGRSDSISQAIGCLTTHEPYDSVKCNFIHQRTVSSLQHSELPLPDLESNAVVFSKCTPDFAVLSCDYVDQDDLHPYLSKDRLRKDCSSGVVLSSHVDANGQQSVIMKRFFMAKFHIGPLKISDASKRMFLERIPSINQRINTIIQDDIFASRFKSLTHG